MGLADFAGSKFQRMANWPVSFFLSKLGDLHETGRLFGAILPVSIFYRNWTSWPSANSSLQNRPIPLGSS